MSSSAPAPAAMAVDDAEDDQLASMSTEEIIRASRLLDNEIRVHKDELQRSNLELESIKEKTKENQEKIKLNKQLPYLVGNIVEILEMNPEDEAEEDGANIDLDAEDLIRIRNLHKSMAFVNSWDTMNTSSDERFTVLRSIGEFIYEHELSVLLEKKLDPICYVWFEPSLTMDIEQGIMKTIYINKMLEAGCTVKILMADWFLQRHPRIGTDLNKIRAIGQYNIEMWKAAGMHLERVELIWLSDELDHHAVDYWTLAMDVSRKYTMERIASYCEYVKPYGPKILPAAEIFYPCMLVAVVLCQKLKVDIWLFSKDQRDFIMLARDYCEDINMGRKPTFLLHNILPSLLEDPEFQNEMDPGQTIFMQDEEDHLDFKMWRMFCPPKVAVCNPCLEYIRSLVFPWFGKFEVVQKEGNGSNKTFASMDELVVDYESGHVDPIDVKLAFVKAINNILEPVAEYFRRNTNAQALITACKIPDQVTVDVSKIIMQNKEI